MRKLLFTIFVFICQLSYAEQTLNERAILCKSFDFSELNVMKHEELESVYCGLVAGDKISEITTLKQEEDYKNDANMRVYIAQQRLKELKQCNSQKLQIKDIMKRNFKKDGFECDKFKGYTSIMQK